MINFCFSVSGFLRGDEMGVHKLGYVNLSYKAVKVIKADIQTKNKQTKKF